MIRVKPLFCFIFSRLTLISMNKIKLLLLFVLLIPFSGSVFSQAFDDGTNLVFIGFGLPPGQRIQKEFDQYKNFIDYKFKNYGTGVFKFEHGLTKYFGMGLNLEYSRSSVTYKYDDTNSLRYQVDITSNVFGFY